MYVCDRVYMCDRVCVCVCVSVCLVYVLHFLPGTLLRHDVEVRDRQSFFLFYLWLFFQISLSRSLSYGPEPLLWKMQGSSS